VSAQLELSKSAPQVVAENP